MKDFSDMRDCVRDVLEGGYAEDLSHPVKFWIISELKRLGVNEVEAVEIMLGWNKRREVPYSNSEIQSKIIDAVGWGYEKDMPLSCRKGGPLRSSICKQENGDHCKFFENQRLQGNRKRLNQNKDVDRFDILGWKEFLAKHHGEIGRLTYYVYKILKTKLILENLTFDDTVYISFRGMVALLKTRYRHFHTNKSDCVRATRLLQDYVLIILVSRGQKGKHIKRGERVRKANGYKIALPVPKPPKKPIFFRGEAKSPSKRKILNKINPVPKEPVISNTYYVPKVEGQEKV